MTKFAAFTALAFFTFVLAASAQEPCRYMKARSGLVGYEKGGPYTLEHFQLTKGRTELRDFLWNHWHKHIKGSAEASAGTVDAGTVTVLYVVQPNAQGQWGINVELGRPGSHLHARLFTLTPLFVSQSVNRTRIIHLRLWAPTFRTANCLKFDWQTPKSRTRNTGSSFLWRTENPLAIRFEPQ
jgi:hypothetical protein